ncbi:MAG: cyanophycin synthetase [Vicinamibacterales bacterium]
MAAFRTLKPVANRLEVVDDAGVTWIRDAYNSNQFGFRAALEVAADLPASRRILVTPGVIELGAEQHPVNRALSREAAAVCDMTLVVSETNRQAFVEGHRDAGREDRLVVVPEPDGRVPLAARAAARGRRGHPRERSARSLRADGGAVLARAAAEEGVVSGTPSRIRPTIAVMFGGRSLEHDVSVVSGLQILHALDPERFAPMPIYIDQQTRWWVGDALWHNASFKGGSPDRSRLIEVTLSSGFGSSKLVPVDLTTIMTGTGSRISGVELTGGGTIPVDCFVPVLHGTYGEDGCVQGALELGGCAYVGCGVMASAIGMNKRATKIMAQHADVPVVRWLSTRAFRARSRTRVAHRLSRPGRRQLRLAGHRQAVQPRIECRRVGGGQRRRVDRGHPARLRVRRRGARRAVHQEPARDQRGCRRSRRTGGLDHRDAGDQPGHATDLCEKIPAPGTQEHRVAGNGRCAARARPAASCRRRCVPTPSATRRQSSRRSAARVSAYRLPDRHRHRTISSSTRSTRCPARWRSTCGRPRRTTGRLPTCSPV